MHAARPIIARRAGGALAAGRAASATVSAEHRSVLAAAAAAVPRAFRIPTRRISSRRTLHEEANKGSGKSDAGSSATKGSASSSSSSSNGSSPSGSGASPSGSSSSSSSTPTTWDALVRLGPAAQAYVIESLPFFRHTSVESHASFAGSSGPTAHVLRRLSPTDASITQSTIRTHVAMLLQLARYVQVSKSKLDIQLGAREAYILLADLMNTFHLAASRKQLKELTSPAVYKAIDASWKELDKIALRLQYKVDVNETVLLDLHIHDSDEHGRGGRGGGGGPRVPVAPPLGSQTAQPPAAPFAGNTNNNNVDRMILSGATLSMASPSGSDSGSSGSSSNGASSSASKPAVKPRSVKVSDPRAVRYADLDIEYLLQETFELWSTRPDQTREAVLKGTAAAESEAAAAASGATTEEQNANKATATSAGDGETQVTAEGALEFYGDDLESARRSAETVEAFATRFGAVGPVKVAYAAVPIASDASGTPFIPLSKEQVDKALKEAQSAMERISREQPPKSFADAKAALEQAVAEATAAANGTTPAAAAAASSTPAASSSSAAPTSSPSSSTSQSPSPSPSPSGSGPPLDENADWPPPLMLLSTVSGESERGLRFTTPLPPMMSWVSKEDGAAAAASSSSSSRSSSRSSLPSPFPPPPQMLWGEPAVPTNDSFIFVTKLAQRVAAFFNVSIGGEHVKNRPKPTWTIKDILD